MDGISVVVPTHAGRESVLDTVRALLSQSALPMEVIVVSDGDATLTRGFLRDVVDGRLRLLEKPQEGANPARNFGLEQATFDWVAFVDDDDVPRENWSETWRSITDDTTLVATAGLAHWKGGILRTTKLCTLSLEDPTMRASRIMAGAFVVRRDLLMAIGGYDAALPAAQNQDLGLRIIEHVASHGIEGTVASSEEVVIDVFTQGAAERSQRYGDRHAGASRIFLDRYAHRMQADPRSRAASLRIIARADRQRGDLRGARTRAWEALRVDSRNPKNIKSVVLATWPRLASLSRLRRLGRTPS